MNRNYLETKIAVIEEKLNSTHDKLEKIEINHLPHIYNKLSSIEKKQAYFAGGTAVAIGTIEIIIKLLK